MEQAAAEGRPDLETGGARAHARVGGARRADHRVLESAEADAIECAEPAHFGHGRVRERDVGALELDDDRQIRMARQHLGETRHADAPTPVWRAARGVEAMPCVDARELVSSAVRDGTGGVGGSIEIGVVQEHDLPIARQPHVELEAVDAQLGGAFEGHERVLGRERRTAPVRDDERAPRRPASRDPRVFARCLTHPRSPDHAPPA